MFALDRSRVADITRSHSTHVQLPACPWLYVRSSFVQARSLLTAHEDFTTLQFCSGGAALDRPGFVFGFLRRRGLPDADVEEVRRDRY